ncbi:MAG: hypothetical protein ACOZBL_02830, partial [Patescibacteria group bacterium]
MFFNSAIIADFKFTNNTFTQAFSASSINSYNSWNAVASILFIDQHSIIRYFILFLQFMNS